MNANQLWAGNDYAYTHSPSRGVNYYSGARRCKVISVRSEDPPPGSIRTNKRTIVTVQFLRDDGEPNGYHAEEDVSARNIFMRWEEYEAEKRIRDRDAEARREQIRKEVEEDELRRERERLIQARKDEKFDAALAMRNIPQRAIVRIERDFRGEKIVLDRRILEEEWGLNDDE